MAHLASLNVAIDP